MTSCANLWYIKEKTLRTPLLKESDKPYEMYLDAGYIGESVIKAEELVVKSPVVRKILCENRLLLQNSVVNLMVHFINFKIYSI